MNVFCLLMPEVLYINDLARQLYLLTVYPLQMAKR